MCIGTVIPTPSAHAVKQLWSENTKPSVIVAVNGLIGRNMKMQKWYIRAGVGQPQMKATNKSVKLNSHNILKSRCPRSYTKFGTMNSELSDIAKSRTPRCSKVKCTPFVRQYDILSNKWGVYYAKRNSEQTIHTRI